MRSRWHLIRALLLVAFAVLPTSRAQAQPSGDATAIARARVWSPTNIPSMNLRLGPQGPGAFEPGHTITCRYFMKEMSGISPKFMCRIADGDEVKVKYGRENGEVYGEVIATRLLWALGFGADRMYPVRVICRGCPEAIGGTRLANGDRLFDPATVERKLDGESLVLHARGGWSWPELDLVDPEAGGSPRAHRDALTLLAVFMQHTDTKPEQQRILCQDEACDHPLMMLNDVGITFGRANLANLNPPGSVNLGEWRQQPVWKGPVGCVGNLPKSLTGTLKDPVISDEGRRFLGGLLTQLSDRQLRDLFATARVELRPPGQVDEWVAVFRAKQREIEGRRCVDPWWTTAPPAFSSGLILWLQSWSNPALTHAMNGVSLLGYTRAYLAIAVLIACAYRLGAGAALMVLIALCSVLTDSAKAIVAFPRPNVVDSRVQVMGMFGQSTSEAPIHAMERLDSRARTADTNDGYGFPSGHVAATTTFVLGVALVCGWRWGWLAAALWLPLMALSRMYLGRHFPGDIMGGIAVGVVTVAIGVLAMTLQRLNYGQSRRVIWRVALAALGIPILVAIAKLPADYDAGRLFGIALGLLMLAPTFDRWAAESPNVSGWMRTARVLAAAACFAAAWFGTAYLLELGDWLRTREGAFIAGAVPAAVILPGALYLTAWREHSRFAWRAVKARPTH